jgi:hypothetical protein
VRACGAGRCRTPEAIQLAAFQRVERVEYARGDVDRRHGARQQFAHQVVAGLTDVHQVAHPIRRQLSHRQVKLRVCINETRARHSRYWIQEREKKCVALHRA